MSEAEKVRQATESTKSLTDDDERRLDEVDKVLTDARDLKRWWDERRDDRKAYRESFELCATHNRPAESSFGFFDEATVAGKKMQVMGNFQEQFFDSLKFGGEKPPKKAVAWTRKQMQEFVLNYFMRVSDFSAPVSFPDYDDEPLPVFLRPFSLCPDDETDMEGFGFELAYFKKPGEAPGKFAEEGKYAIVDLRRLLGEKKTYEWIVVKVNIFDFDLRLAPFGRGYPFGTVPLTEESYLVLSEDFVTDDRAGGRYGFGYGFLRDLGDSLLGYGPGRFDAAFQVVDFHVQDDGEVRSQMAFVANRPRKLVDVSVDPVKWGLGMADMMSFGMFSGMLEPLRSVSRRLPQLPGVDLAQLYIQTANAMSLGAAERRLCISKKQLEKIFLVQHFAQHYNMVAGALVTWRLIPDWTKDLPAWVESGETV